MTAAHYEIRALSLAEILDAGFQLLRDRFLLLAGLSMVAFLPQVALGSTFSWAFDPLASVSDTTDLSGVVAVGFVLYALTTFLAVPFVGAAVTEAVGRLYLGESVDLRRAARAGLSRYMALALTYAVFGLVTLLVVLVVSAVLITTGMLLVNLSATPGSPLALALRILLAVFLTAVYAGLLGAVVLVGFILPQVVVFERSSLLRAIARGWDLLGGMRWRAFGVVASAYLIVMVPTTGLQFLVGVWPVAGTFLWSIAQAVGAAFIAASSVVLYFDIRCRKEAFDVEHLARLVERRAEASAG